MSTVNMRLPDHDRACFIHIARTYVEVSAMFMINITLFSRGAGHVTTACHEPGLEGIEAIEEPEPSRHRDRMRVLAAA
jgi:hypothetical protein